MTSQDGFAWYVRASATNNTWNAVAYGNSKFVAVAASGTGDRVMTSSSTSLIGVDSQLYLDTTT